MSQNKAGVVFSGENPGLTLYKPGTDELVAQASYWRCVISEHGEGNVLFIWVDPDGSGLGSAAPSTIYSDNAAMGKLVRDRLMQHFRGHEERRWGRLEPAHARFFQESDSRWYHRVTCNTGEAVIELLWWDVIEYQMLNRSAYQVGPTSWDLATVICPCASATISVANQKVNGEVRSSTEGEKPTSSAFLAFSETWVDRG